MVVVLSRFKVANGREADVAEAFRRRPRAVEQAAGFLWLEVFTDHADPAVFYLLTRWADRQSFDDWHGSAAHRESHAFIPRGLKLDPEWTHVFTLDRIDTTTGTALTDAIVDATRLVDGYLTSTTAIHLIVLDAAGTILAANAAATQQLEPDGLVGQPVDRYMPAPDAARLREILGAGSGIAGPVRLNFGPHRRQPFTLECRLDVRRDGATIIGQPLFRREQQLHDELMAINEELAVLTRERSRQVADERSGREAAERLNRERNAFLTVLAHELRQPLGSALAALGVLRKMNPDPNLDRPRAVLERQINQVRRLVEDLADTARVAAGDVELRRVPVDLVAHLRGLATVWEAMAHQQHKRFTCTLPAEPLVVSADAERLQQVFSNLVGNAFKYTPPEALVAVTLKARDDFAVVTVEDEGEGIPPDRLPRIFALFERATTTAAGLGVGLAVVRALVEAHGGAVQAASPGLGHGTAFTVTLPLLGSTAVLADGEARARSPLA